MLQISHFFTKFKIPTILGIAIIVIGIGSGVYLTTQQQNLSTQASPDQKPNEVIFSNIQDESASISWETDSPTAGFVTFGINSPDEQTALDVKDTNETQSRTEHFVNIKNLTPKTTYKIQIVSGNLKSPVKDFTTASSSLNQNKLQPIIGSVVNADDQPLDQGIAFLAIAGATLQSSPISSIGSFTIPLAKVYSENLANILPLDQTTKATLKIISSTGEATVSFPLSLVSNPLPPI